MNEIILNAVIESAEISYSDRGFLDIWLTLDYGGPHQGFGGYVLYLPKTCEHHSIESPAGHFLFRCMEIAGVEKWSQIKGKTIRVQKKGDRWGQIIAIGHIVKDDWFNPEDDWFNPEDDFKCLKKDK